MSPAPGCACETGPYGHVGCEGRCGCHLARLGRSWWELAPSGASSLGYQAVAEHTAARCLAIRVLREAAEDAAGADGEATIAVDRVDDPQLFCVRVETAAARAEVPVLPEWVIDVPREQLDDQANRACGRLRDLLDGGDESPWCSSAATLARTPGARR